MVAPNLQGLQTEACSVIVANSFELEKTREFIRVLLEIAKDAVFRGLSDTHPRKFASFSIKL